MRDGGNSEEISILWNYLWNLRNIILLLTCKHKVHVSLKEYHAFATVSGNKDKKEIKRWLQSNKKLFESQVIKSGDHMIWPEFLVQSDEKWFSSGITLN